MSYLLGVINTSTNKYENIYFVDKKININVLLVIQI